MEEYYINSIIAFLFLIIIVYNNLWIYIFYIGMIRLIILFIHSWKIFKRQFLNSKLDLLKRYGNKSYVLITGAANGIGKEYSIWYGKEGFSIILIDKDQQGLENTTNELKGKFSNIDIISKVQDLTTLNSAKNYEKFVKDFNEYDISILVNNAGFMDCHDLHKADEKGIIDILKVNWISMVLLTKIFQVKMKSRNNKSWIINMSSTIGGAPAKIVPMYSPTKGFVRFFTESLANETDKNIDYLVVTPGSITTEFTLNRKFIDTCMPNTLVRNVINSLGQTQKTSGWWLHEIWDEAQTGIWYFNHETYTFIMELFGRYFGYNTFITNVRTKRSLN